MEWHTPYLRFCLLVVNICVYFFIWRSLPFRASVMSNSINSSYSTNASGRNKFSRKMKFTLVKTGQKVSFVLVVDVLSLQLNPSHKSKSESECESVSRIHNVVKSQKVSP